MQDGNQVIIKFSLYLLLTHSYNKYIPWGTIHLYFCTPRVDSPGETFTVGSLVGLLRVCHPVRGLAVDVHVVVTRHHVAG